MDATPSATSLKDLPDDVQALKRLLIEHEALVAEQRSLISQLQRDKEGLSHRVALLLQRIYGRGSERIDARQMLLFGQAMSQTPAPVAEPQEEAAAEHKPTSKRQGHGRRPLPADLPRHRIEHPIDPEQLTCPCCGGERRRIGEVISEQLDYVPASLFVVEHPRGTRQVRLQALRRRRRRHGGAIR